MRPFDGFRHAAFVASLACGFASTQALAQVNVVATIPAVHSIVSGVMGDTGQPHLLVPGAASPHTYSLKPSNAQALADSQLVVWVGPDLEAFLDDKLTTLAPNAELLTLQTLDGTVHHPIREGGLWDAHDHDHGHGDHGDHADHNDHADHHDHDHDKDHAGHDDHADHHDHSGHDHASHDDHDHHDDHKDHAGHDDHAAHAATVDVHMWLDPTNALVLSKAVADALSKIDPENATVYAANQASQAAEIESLDRELADQLSTIKSKPFIVFHDAYQYFETRYGLRGVGSVTVSPEVAPGAARVREIRERIEEREAACVFAEPQFKPSILEAVTEGTGAKTGVLDPVGADIEPGAALYGELMRQLASDLSSCLADPA